MSQNLAAVVILGYLTLDLDQVRPKDILNQPLRAGDVVQLVNSSLSQNFIVCWRDPYNPRHYPAWFLLAVDANLGSLGDRVPVTYSPLRKVGSLPYPESIALETPYPESAPEELRTREAFNISPT